ncbi:MAG: GtrA family protein [Bacteroidota bacterium]|nr:GtrA family protein [Bacteroidota bacterium]
MIRIILQNKLIRKLVKFGIVGAASFVAGYITYAVLCELHLMMYHDVKKYYLIYQVIGSIVGLFVSYVVNKNWTFRHQTHKEKKYFRKFAMVYAIGFFINIALVYYFVDIADYLPGYLHKNRLFLAPIFATVISSGINFLASNKLVFKVEDVEEE